MSTDAKVMVLVNQQNGVSIIPQPTPLTRLHYFDGKYLKASDLTVEQTYLRRLVQISNQAGGSGVAYGYDLSRALGDSLHLAAGLAIDPQGRVLLLPQEFQIGVQDLIDKSLRRKVAVTKPKTPGAFGDCAPSAAAPPDGAAVGAELYLISVCAAEALCGQEDVFGVLCEDACAKSTERPYSVEGILLRVTPLTLQAVLPASAAVPLTRRHLRSRVASAWFDDERHVIESQISGAGLKSDVWCFGAQAQSGQCVNIGVLARAGTSTVFLDAWTTRRERIDTPAKRYWQWRMAMRPWDVFLAQILQFQCQLSDLYRNGGGGSGEDDPCHRAHSLVIEASNTVAKMVNYYQSVTSRFTLTPLLADKTTAASVAQPQLEGGLTALLDFHKRLLEAGQDQASFTDQFLIDGGIVSAPSAGYLPVTPSSVVSVNEQVRRLLGRGVDLRFCIVRPDFVPHALEEAQHMERISLLEGLDNPKLMPEVDVLVPNGIVLQERPTTGAAYEAKLLTGFASAARPIDSLATVGRTRVFNGAADILVAPAGAAELFAAVSEDGGKPANWVALTSSVNPFASFSGGQTLLQMRTSSDGGDDFLLNGSLVYEVPVHTPNQITLKGVFNGTLTRSEVSRITLEVSGVLVQDANLPRLALTFINRQSGLSFEATAAWSGSPRKIVLRLSSANPGTVLGGTVSTTPARSILEADFTQNDDVLLPANPLHKQALAALDTIGLGLKDTQFAAQAAGQLFPAAPASQDLRIQAVLDWVIFHRRRTKQCQIEAPTVQVSGRKFQFWHGLVADERALKQVRDTLNRNAPLDPALVAFQRVDVVEFAAGVQTLVSSGDALRTDWNAVHPGQKIHYGFIANGPEAQLDGQAVSLGRASAVEQALSFITPTLPDAVLEMLAAIPTELAAPETDGIMGLLTILETTCLTVIEISNEVTERVRALVANGKMSEAIQAGQTLAEIHFFAGGTRVIDNSLDDLKAHFNQPHGALVVVQNNNQDLPQALAQQQGDVVHAALGGGPALELLTSPQPLPACPVAMFIFTAPQNAPALPRTGRAMLAARDAAGNHSQIPGFPASDLKFTPEGALDGKFSTATVRALVGIGGAVQVELSPVEANFDRGAAETRLKAVIEALKEARAYNEKSPPAVNELKPGEQVLGQGINDVIFLRQG